MEEYKNTSIYAACEDSDRKLMEELIYEHETFCRHNAKCKFWHAAFLGACVSEYLCVINYVLIYVDKALTINDILELWSLAPKTDATTTAIKEYINNRKMFKMLDKETTNLELLEHVINKFDLIYNDWPYERIEPRIVINALDMCVRHDYVRLYDLLHYEISEDMYRSYMKKAVRYGSLNIMQYIDAHMWRIHKHNTLVYQVQHIICDGDGYSMRYDIKQWRQYVKHICSMIKERNITITATLQMLWFVSEYGYYDLFRCMTYDTLVTTAIIIAIHQAICNGYSDIAEPLILYIKANRRVTEYDINRAEILKTNNMASLVTIYRLVSINERSLLCMNKQQMCHLLNHGEELPYNHHVNELNTYHTLKQNTMQLAFDEYAQQVNKTYYDKNVMSIISQYVSYDEPKTRADTNVLMYAMADDEPIVTHTTQRRRNRYNYDEQDCDNYDNDDYVYYDGDNNEPDNGSFGFM